MPTLFIVFLISAGLIGLVEIGIEKLPHASRQGNIFGSHTRSQLARRADTVVATPNPATPNPNTYVPPTVNPPPPVQVSTPPAQQVTTPNQPQPTGTTIGGGYVPPTIKEPAQVSTPPVQVTTPPVQVTTPPVQVTTPPVQVTTPPVQVTTPPVQVTTPPVQVTTPPVQQTTLATTNPAAYVPPTVTQPMQGTPPPGQATSATAPAAYVPPSITPPVQTTVAGTAGSVYVPPDPPKTPQIVQDTNTYAPTTAPTGYVPPTVVPSATSGGYVPPSVTPTLTTTGGYVPPSIIPAVTTTGGYVPPSGTFATNPAAYVTTVVSGSTIVVIPASASVDGSNPTSSGTILPYSAVSISTMVTVSSTIVTSVPETIVTTDAQGHLTTSVTFVPTTTVAVQAVETTMLSTSQKGVNYSFPMWSVFVGGNYMILLIVVLFRQFWTAIYSQAKLIEPFTRLEDSRGIPASQVLDSFYLSSTLMPDPIVAIARKHWLALWTSLIYFSVGLLGPVGSETLFLTTDYPNCPFQNNNPTNPCWPPRLSIDPTIARVLQGLLTYTAIMTLTIMVMVWRMRTGIYSDPSAIASIASLVHHPEVIEDFRLFGPEASLKTMMQAIGQKWYKLDDYQKPDGTWRYGLVPAAPGQLAHDEVPVEELKMPRPRLRRWRAMDVTFDSLFILALVGLLGVVVGYFKDHRDDGFNRFFDNHQFGPRFLLTAIGTLIAINWRRLERGTLSSLFTFEREIHS